MKHSKKKPSTKRASAHDADDGTRALDRYEPYTRSSSRSSVTFKVHDEFDGCVMNAPC